MDFEIVNTQNKNIIASGLFSLLIFSNFLVAKASAPTNFANEPTTAGAGSWSVYDEAQLHFIPYVSSYIPKNEGQLFYGNKGYSFYKSKQSENSKKNENELLNNVISKFTTDDIHNQTHFGTPTEQFSLNRLSNILDVATLDKFELLRRQVLNSKPLNRSDYNIGKSIFDPKAEMWEGLCNQWSGAALEPIIAEQIKNLSPIKCNNITLFPSEIRELITTFYNSSKEFQFFGVRNNRQSLLRENFETILAHDDLPADVFHKVIFENLKNNQGVIMDKDHGDTVWNHPIYKAISHGSLKTSIDEISFDKLIFVPLNLLYSDNNEISIELQNLMAEENLLKRKANKLISEQLKIEKWYDQYFKEAEQPLIDQVKNFFERKAMFLGTKKLNLQPGYQIRWIKTTTRFVEESAFGQGGVIDDEHLSVEYKFEYWLFEKNNKVVSSSWITPASQRPDFVWIPERKYTHLNSLLSEQSPLGELFNIINQCSPPENIKAFYLNLEVALKDNIIDENELEQFSKEWPSVQKQVSKEWLHQRLEGAQGSIQLNKILN